ncbi:MAG: hypothetical protein ABJZ55_13135 [Fuerstiella sp.]
MPRQLYCDYARFGAILPDCACLLREFADILEAKGQFPAFDPFLIDGSSAWSPELQQQFPVVAQWQGLEALRTDIRELCGAPADSTVLFSGTSRQLARIAFQCLLNECESILCTDQDWPEFQHILKLQVAQAGAILHHTTLRPPDLPIDFPRPDPKTVAESLKKHGCDGMLLTSIAHDGISILPNDVAIQLSHPLRFSVIDGSQHVGYRPVELPSEFRGIVLGGTHKWLCSGVPMSFAVYVHGKDRAAELRQLRKAVRTSAYDDMLLLRTADLGLNPPNQTMRLEPLLTAFVAVRHALNQNVVSMFQHRCENSHQLFELVREQQTPLFTETRQGFAWAACEILSASTIQKILGEQGLTLSNVGKHLRFSLPSQPFSAVDNDVIENALAALSNRYTGRLYELNQLNFEPDSADHSGTPG